MRRLKRRHYFYCLYQRRNPRGVVHSPTLPDELPGMHGVGNVITKVVTVPDHSWFDARLELCLHRLSVPTCPLGLG